MKTLEPLDVTLAGPHLVEASAGTGKTFTLTTLYLRLLLEERLPIGDILVVTYTKAATAELRQRLRGRLRDAWVLYETDVPVDPKDEILIRLVRERRDAGHADGDKLWLTQALRSFDEAAIFTIHGFCQRMLVDNAFESRSTFDTELVTDATPLLREIAEDFWTNNVFEVHAEVLRLTRRMARKREHQLNPTVLEKLARRAIADPDLEIVSHCGPRPAGDAVVASLDAFRASLARLADAWPDSREPVLTLLSDGRAGLNKSSYKADAVPRWIASMDALLADRERALGLFKEFDRFTPAVLRAKTNKGGETPRHPFFDRCGDTWTAHESLKEAAQAWRVGLEREFVAYARAEAEQRHAERNTQSFDDLLRHLRDSLAAPAGGLLASRIQSRYRAALIDEFQDTDPVQYEIFDRIYGKSDFPLFYIGDPKQAIYAFRGADVFAYLKARNAVPDDPHTLDVNYRSDRGLVRALNTLFGDARQPFLFEAIPFHEMEADKKDPAGRSSAPMEILLLSPGPSDGPMAKGTAEETIPAGIASEIVDLLRSEETIDGEPIKPRHIAVLCRKNAEAHQIQEALRAVGIPSVRQGDDSVFDSPEAGELERVLRAMAEPDEPARIRSALATRILGQTAAELRDLQTGKEERWDEWASHFHDWATSWKEKGFMPAFRRMLSVTGAYQRLLQGVDGERSLTNLLHLGELLQTEVTAGHRGPLALVDWLVEMRRDKTARARLSGEAAEIRLESDRDAVQLTTIHKSKGLEYGVVFCPYLFDGSLLRGDDDRWLSYHDPDRDDRLCMDIGPAGPEFDAHKAIARHEALGENLRLLYVALTRARHRLFVVWGAIKQSQSSALAYLLHQAPDGASASEIAAATEKRAKKLSPAQIEEDLQALCARSDGTIGVRPLRLHADLYEEDEGTAGPLAAREAKRELDHSFRSSSFSALTAGERRLGHRAEEGIDHDEQTRPVDPTMRTAEPERRVRLAAFPAGARPGQTIHTILEHLDFRAPEGPEARRLMVETLGRAGLADSWTEELLVASREIAETPLVPQHELTLAGVEPSHMLRELGFTMPVAGDGSGVAVRARDVAHVMRTHAEADHVRRYAEDAESLRFQPLTGYLTGFIDLVFEWRGRWFVVDYKSNHLGDEVGAYAPDALPHAMREHHYYLQYHLYLVALDQHLRARLPGYDYDRHMGGVLYLYVRGMAPDHPAGAGVFFDRPPRSLVEQLSALLQGSGTTAPVAQTGATP